MNVMIDTNVILDDILQRTPNETDARRVVNFVADGVINGFTSASSITDIHFIAKKRHGTDATKEIIRGLLLNFNVIAVDGQSCIDALNMGIDDFEDALVVVCAQSAKLDYIITNDKGFLNSNLPVPTINPLDFCQLIDALCKP